jgi:hypothetical protein
MEIDSEYSDLEDVSSEYEPENSPAPKAKVTGLLKTLAGPCCAPRSDPSDQQLW